MAIGYVETTADLRHRISSAILFFTYDKVSERLKEAACKAVIRRFESVPYLQSGKLKWYKRPPYKGQTGGFKSLARHHLLFLVVCGKLGFFVLFTELAAFLIFIKIYSIIYI